MFTKWWGEFDFSQNHTGLWKIGPLTLVLQKRKCEWVLQSDYTKTYVEDESSNSFVSHFEFAHIDKRITDTSKHMIITVAPLLANRPIVARPENPFYVPGHDTINVYISSPLWMEIKIRDSEKILEQLPISRPSDTWFGKSTIDGELCYASKTHARLRLEHIKKRPYRAITVVKIKNNVRTPLRLDRIKIPSPNLSLFASENSFFWTETMCYQRSDENGNADVTIEKSPPQEACPYTLFCSPRERIDRSMVSRVFNSIF